MSLMESAQLLGNFGEFVGAIAVVVTLAYLSVQVRQHSEAVRSSTRSDIARGQMDANYVLAQNPELVLNCYSLLRGKDLGEAERVAATHAILAGFRMFENQFFAYREGTFSESVWLGYRANIAWNTQQPNFADFWNDRRYAFSSEFVEFVDELHGEQEPV